MDPNDLVLTSLPTRLGTVYGIVLDGKKIVTTGDRCYASSNGKNFHRRTVPSRGFSYAYSSILVDGVIYNSRIGITRDHGATWKVVEAYPKARHALFRDAKGTWWLGGEAQVLSSKKIDTGWKQVFKIPGDKAVAFMELDGKLFVAGTGSGTWSGKRFTPAKGLAGATITRIREAPSGVLVCHGDGGCAFRSVNRGKTWTRVKTGVKHDLEDSAWVAGALFVVGGGGTLLRSTNEGRSFKKLATGIKSKLWRITSWGDGALLAGDDGVMRTLAAPGDPFWQGATDDFAPPPFAIDSGFKPIAARTPAERDATYATLHAETVAVQDERSAKLRAQRAPDANPTLASEVEASEDALAVYADWLQDQGDPRGELAQLQLKLAKQPKLAPMAKALLNKHAGVLLGKLAGLDSVLALEWRAGFISTARIGAAYGSETDIVAALGWLLDHPSARFLRALSIGIASYDDNDYRKIAQVIAKRYLPCLHTLRICDVPFDKMEIESTTIGPVTAMLAAMPNLRDLTLRGTNAALGSIALAHLERFSFVTSDFDRKTAKAIATATWPALRRLELDLGPADQPKTAARVGDLLPILDGARLPRLEHLAVASCPFTSKLVEPLACSRLLPQLTSLDLRYGTLGDEGVRSMYRLQRAFAHLGAIDLAGNYITDEGQRMLEGSKLNIGFGDQRDDEGEASSREIWRDED